MLLLIRQAQGPDQAIDELIRWWPLDARLQRSDVAPLVPHHLGQVSLAKIPANADVVKERGKGTHGNQREKPLLPARLFFRFVLVNTLINVFSVFLGKRNCICQHLQS